MNMTKKYITKVIKEELLKELSSQPYSTGYGMHTMPNMNVKIANFPDGERPEQSTQQRYEGRPPYETLGIKSELDGSGRRGRLEIGHTFYNIFFNNDKTGGTVIPEGKYEFTVEGNEIKWNASVPYHVMNNSAINNELKKMLELEE